jgi:hypothetical protein
MKKPMLITIFLLLIVGFVSSQVIPSDSLYLGQTPPGCTPQIFNLSVNAGSFAAERIAISSDSKNIYYSEVHSYYPVTGDTIKCYSYSGGNWTGPFNSFNGFVSPALSLTGDTMYFQNNNIPYQTLFSVKNGLSWSNPQRFLYSLNSAHYFQEINNGSYYVSSISNPGIGGSDWCKLYINGADTNAISLGLPLNSGTEDLDLFVSKNDSFMIVAKYAGNTTRLNISYHKDNGDWTNPKSLGSAINFGLGAWGPYVSADDKYLFYTTGTNPDYSDTHIYWVRIDGLVDSLKHTNYIPYVKNHIPNQSAIVGQLFSYTIPDSTFSDDDGNNTLFYSAKLTNGNPLPAWLAFDSITRTFKGNPDIVQTLNIKIKATDTQGASASTTLKIIVKLDDGLDQINEHGVLIYPNPTRGLLNIKLDALTNKLSTVEISNLEGKVILSDAFNNEISIDLSLKPKGIYVIKLITGDDIIIKRFYLN